MAATCFKLGVCVSLSVKENIESRLEVNKRKTIVHCVERGLDVQRVLFSLYFPKSKMDMDYFCEQKTELF